LRGHIKGSLEKLLSNFLKTVNELLDLYNCKAEGNRHCETEGLSNLFLQKLRGLLRLQAGSQ